MIFRGVSKHKFFRPVAGAALTALGGLALWVSPLEERWSDASYDNLVRFGAREVTNKVVLVQMDDAGAEALHTTRADWDRGLHAQLLEKLIEGGSPLVVFDIHFLKERTNSESDARLAKAMRRHGRVVLMAKAISVEGEDLKGAQVIYPNPRFLEAATNWGIGKLFGVPVRRHSPCPAPMEGYPSLPWTAAGLLGVRLIEVPEEQWLRYYGQGGGLEILSYPTALAKPPAFFHDRVVFIGSRPQSEDPTVSEEDKFSTPYTTLLGGPAVGGMEILATEFLNLVNGDWLRRPRRWVEGLVLGITGTLLGAGLSRFRRFAAFGVAVGAATVFTMAAVCLSFYTNYWFPWLIVVGAQVPCALAWTWMATVVQVVAPVSPAAPAVEPRAPKETIVLNLPEEQLPDAPEYELISPAIGRGGFGQVWIARNAIGQWQALKAVYQSTFGGNRAPYEMEFKGLQRYKPVSEKHPGLLRIDLVSKMKIEGYFYYVMELGDAQAPGWEQDPTRYKPRDLENLRKQAYGRRLPVADCLRTVTVLADALDFLHKQGLTHRDIKPSNVIFVNGRPKLADIGLVADIRPLDQVHTFVGTPGYMPPPPEKPGTPQADIYALGMLLYVISTGRDPGFFPELSTTLMEPSGHAEFVQLNAIILKACQPDTTLRYQTTTEMLRDLQETSKAFGLN